MGKTFVCNSLEDMCHLMCDNDTTGLEDDLEFLDEDAELDAQIDLEIADYLEETFY